MAEHDEGVLLQLIHESLKIGEIDEGITYLDELLECYAADQRIEQIKDTMVNLVKLYPNSKEIRKRHVAIQARFGNKVRVVEQLTIIAEQMDGSDD